MNIDILYDRKPRVVNIVFFHKYVLFTFEYLATHLLQMKTLAIAVKWHVCFEYHFPDDI